MKNATADFLTVSDAAAICAVAAATIRQWEAAGKIPALRTAGGMRLFKRADVEQIASTRAARACGLAGLLEA